ncbi:MAG: MBL fold metallo-hydrolase [Chloroflexota bacterium]
MRITGPGRISERIELLGNYDMSMYLVKGDEGLIIGGGMSYIVPEVEEQFARLDFDLGRVRYLVIPHSHFDHCGAVPYLKRRLPDLQILAAQYASEVLVKPKVVDFIARVNKDMVDRLGLQAEYDRLCLEFDGVPVDRVVGDGDVLDLGQGIEAQFAEVPGHSRCCVATYIPQLRALFPTDAVPLPSDVGDELSYPSAQFDFSAYMNSLHKLMQYEVEVVGLDHKGAFLGDQARDFMRRGLEQTERTRDYILEQYREIGDLEKTAEKIAAEVFEKNDLAYMSHQLMVSITRSMIDSLVANERRT